MTFMILVSFFLIGGVSFYYFKNQNELYHQQRLKRKKHTVKKALDHFLKDKSLSGHTDSIVKIFDTEICELASINNIDVNIYGMNGNLLISSRPELYKRGIIPEELNKSLMRKLRESPDEITDEIKKGALNYISTFDYIHNYQNKPIAVINLPYFDIKKIQKQDLYDFLMQISEVYSLLFIAACVIAYFLSNYITSSLRAISAMIKNTKINGHSPPLKWKFDDEVGALVYEYKRMLKKLQKSTVKLAKAERESAWKEIAKQVAHEIKNPLTPMRLNIQYLEKSLETNEPEKLKEFSNGMTRQIDTLSSIAEAFSRFASSPVPKIERFPVKEMIEQIPSLYPGHNIAFNCTDFNIKIKADKNHLVRAMNNLINNAIQSIPQNRKPQIEVNVKKIEEDIIRISVKDNGIGIPTEQQGKIFEPHFTTKTRGMGLGLAIVKNIIDSFEGKIWFETKESIGTTFHIELPLLEDLVY